MPSRRPLTILFALATVLALVAAACGDDAASTGDAPEQTDTVPDPTPADTTAPDAALPATTAEETGPDEIVLTDSYRGVTADAITIGLALVDFEKINELFGLDLTPTPQEEMYRAWADVVNANGGVNGRDVLIEYRGMQPVGSEDSDRVCLELMEDKEVFVVIGQFLQDAMLCITQTHGHPYVGHFGETPERQEKSNGLLFATEIAQTDQRAGGTRAMVDSGDFDGKKVAVVWASAEDEVYFEAVDPVLDAGGVDVVAEIGLDAFTTDQLNNQNAWDVAMEQIRAADADVILNLSGITGPLDAAERTGADITIAHTNGQAADGSTVLEESIASERVLENSFAITTWKPNIDEALADTEVQRCIAEFEAAYPDIEVDFTSSDWVNSFTNNCRAFALTVKILEAAGGDITPETFRAAGEGLGTFDLPAMAGATLGPGKHSAGSTLSRYEYDPGSEQYVKVGEPISLTG